MKQLFFLLLLVITGSVYAQENNQKELDQLDALIEEAVKNEEYQKAANLKQEKELRLELAKAVKEEDYRRAAELKQQLAGSSGNNTQIIALEKELQKAIAREDYTEASRLKQEMENIKNGGNSISPSNTSNSVLPEPEFQNQVVYYSQSSNKTVELEKQTPELKTSSWAAPGYAKSSSYYLIKNEKSPVRFKDGNNLQFMVKLPPGIDPSEMFRLVEFEVKKGNRIMEYITASGTGWGSGGANTVSENDMEISFDRVKEGVYLIKPRTSLPRGEYTFYYAGNKMYAFGVDR